MASASATVAFIVDQASARDPVHARAMFGEYGLYCHDRLVALVCDDQLFVKPTTMGRAHAPDAAEAPPYPGAKPCLLIDAGQWDDRDWLSDLFQLTAAALPPPKPRKTARAQAARG